MYAVIHSLTITILFHEKTLFSLALGTLSLSVSATEFWAPGVKKDDPTTYYDVNKVFSENEETSKGDSVMCWAAASSNIMAWWQQQNKENLKNVQNVPEGAEEIWATYQQAFYNAGYDGNGGIGWFMMGDEYLKELDPDYIPRDMNYDLPGGYYKDLLSAPESLLTSGYMAVYDNEAPIVRDYITLESFSTQIVDAIKSGCALCLGLTGIEYVGGHAITLWGVDYNEDSGLIEKMFITDSDDNFMTNGEADGLLTITLGKTTLEKWTDKSQEEMIEFFTMYDDITPGGRWYHGTEYIDSFASLNAHATFLNKVPEPATATLSLLALSGLLMRRRRKA